jgi:predicted GNAT family acetyltransferase
LAFTKILELLYYLCSICNTKLNPGGGQSVKLNVFDQIEPFYQQVQPYLIQQEAKHNLLLRLCRRLLARPEHLGSEVYLAAVTATDQVTGAEQVVAVAIRTSPYPLVLSQVTQPEALKLIAEDLSARCNELPAAGGLVDEAKLFAQAWQAVTGQTYQLAEKRRIYQLQQVQAVPISSGYLRVANSTDRPLLRQWLEAFELEALGRVEGDLDQALENRLQQNSLYIWQDEVPTTFVGGNGTAPDFGWIAPVYTPPELRRRGYATSAVATVSQLLLERGCRCCFLFTDLQNPTSNRIYQKIGYQPICDWHEYRFSRC